MELGSVGKVLSNAKWKTSLRDRDLKKVGRDEVSTFLIDNAREAIAKVDLSEGAKFLDADFGLRSACGWVHYKFGFLLDPAEVHAIDAEGFKRLVRDRAAKAYAEKDVEFPVMAGLSRSTTTDAGGS